MSTKRAITLAEWQQYSQKRKHKFNAQHTWCNNIRFDSKREAQRYEELLLLQLRERIRTLQLQRQFMFFEAGIKVDRWRIDFCYEERQPDDSWIRVAEDITGFITPAKKRHIKYFEQQYGIGNNYTPFEQWYLKITM